MRVHLIRHAQAGDRTPGHHDRYRQLSPQGRERASQLASLLCDQHIGRVISSPATRCAQTVAPLAAALGLEVEERDELWEGTSIPVAMSTLAELSRSSADDLVACSHGDMIPGIVEALQTAGAEVVGRGCEKGSVWVLDGADGRWIRAVYLNRSRTDVPARPEGLSH